MTRGELHRIGLALRHVGAHEDAGAVDDADLEATIVLAERRGSELVALLDGPELG
jgi:hypothetical protein